MPLKLTRLGSAGAIEDETHNGAKIIVIDPRFNRTAAVADYFMRQFVPGLTLHSCQAYCCTC